MGKNSSAEKGCRWGQAEVRASVVGGGLFWVGLGWGVLLLGFLGGGRGWGVFGRVDAILKNESRLRYTVPKRRWKWGNAEEVVSVPGGVGRNGKIAEHAKREM